MTAAPIHKPSAQRTNTVLMIRPAHFCANTETLETNEFQVEQVATDALHKRALLEFEGLVKILGEAGVNVVVADDHPDPSTPDAVFPNNWFTTHADGRVVVYPMQPVSRRGERRPNLLRRLAESHGLYISDIADWSHHEADGRFLEGTGSLVLDRINRVAYACRSLRTSKRLALEFGEQFGYRVELFHAFGTRGLPVYHTNVMLCIGTGYAVICDGAILDRDERKRVLHSLAIHHEIVTITPAQMNRFAGNMLELAGSDGEPLLVMSRRAEESLTDVQRATLGEFAKIVSAPINTIEDAAGGSVRCMLGEIFLPRESGR